MAAALLFAEWKVCPPKAARDAVAARATQAIRV